MRYEYHCVCGAMLAAEAEIEEDELGLSNHDLLQARYECQVATHIANCRQALRNYPIKEARKTDD